ncbi:MAG: glycosyltransferase [Firmicutes bacterium]|nr:glycosyltransferase [Bacillota bacterium]
MSASLPIAVFVREFLGISATFIYRQMQGVKPEFEPFALCRKAANPEIFPCEKVYAATEKNAGKDTLAEKISSKAKRFLTGYYNLPGKNTYKYWAEVLKKEDCRLIHAHFGEEGIMMAPLARETGIPLIVTLHGYDMSRLLNRRGYVGKLRDMFDACTLVIAVSDKFRNDAVKLGCPPEKIIRHYIGVPVEEFTYTPRNKKSGEELVLLQVSNFVEKKGHKYTLQAFANALKKGANIRLVFAGGGTLLEECRNFASELGISNRVEFPGKKPMQEIPGFMAQADIFVHHSITAADGDTEGIPTVLMEAMATGLPILSTYHAGIPELVEDKTSGLLSGEKDVEQYTQQLFNLTQSPELRMNLGNAARSRIEDKFNMNKQNLLLKELYQKAAARK